MFSLADYVFIYKIFQWLMFVECVFDEYEQNKVRKTAK